MLLPMVWLVFLRFVYGLGLFFHCVGEGPVSIEGARLYHRTSSLNGFPVELFMLLFIVLACFLSFCLWFGRRVLV